MLARLRPYFISFFFSVCRFDMPVIIFEKRFWSHLCYRYMFFICVDKTRDDLPNNFACYWDEFLSTSILHKKSMRPLAEISRLNVDDEKLPSLNENILIQGAASRFVREWNWSFISYARSILRLIVMYVFYVSTRIVCAYMNNNLAHLYLLIKQSEVRYLTMYLCTCPWVVNSSSSA